MLRQPQPRSTTPVAMILVVQSWPRGCSCTKDGGSHTDMQPALSLTTPGLRATPSASHGATPSTCPGLMVARSASMAWQRRQKRDQQSPPVRGLALLGRGPSRPTRTEPSGLPRKRLGSRFTTLQRAESLNMFLNMLL